MSYYDQLSQESPILFTFYLLLMIAEIIISYAALWAIFEKAGKPGWAALIPFYGNWVLYKIVCGRGTAMFRLLIPLYNIYWMILTNIKLAHAFGRTTGFGFGLAFLSPVFECILGFGRSRYIGPQQM
ncbi:MAG: signal peptidase I [Clostridia bacterium]|nr:signal peptidase I [Clostridia bacterium]